MKVLVVGGCGFIGSHIVDKLVEKYDPKDIFVLDNLGRCKTTKDAAPSEFYFINKRLKSKNLLLQMDARNILSCNSILQTHSFDVIIFATSSGTPAMSLVNPPIFFNNEVVTVENILNNLPSDKETKVIYLSCASIYEAYYDELTNYQVDVYEDSPIYEYNHFALAKQTCEKIIKIYCKRKDSKISGLILRPCDVYGPRQLSCGDTGIVALLASMLSKPDRKDEIMLKHYLVAPYIYVKDLASIIVNFLDHEIKDNYEVINVGPEFSICLCDMFNIRSETGRTIYKPLVKSRRYVFTFEYTPEKGFKELMNYMKQVEKEKIELKERLESKEKDNG